MGSPGFLLTRIGERASASHAHCEGQVQAFFFTSWPHKFIFLDIDEQSLRLRGPAVN